MTRSDPASTCPARRLFLRRALLAGGMPLLAATGCATGRRGVEITGNPANDAHLAMPAAAAHPDAAASTAAVAAGLLAAPDFAEGRIRRFVAGIRPFRTGRVRIEIESFGRKTLIHNYGHGGAGVTLSWGSAAEVLRLAEMVLKEQGPPSRHGVAVLGAGVIGLTAAHELLRAGYRVRIYAKSTTDTTSHIAGAQWAPSIVARGNPPGDSGFFTRIVRTSHDRFRSLIRRDGWGVFERPNFDAGAGAGGGGLQHIPADLIPPVEYVDPLPIAGVSRPGRIYRTMIIEPPVFMPRLLHEVQILGGEVEARTFTSMTEVLDLPESIIINCLGLGARDVVTDARLVPMRGQLVHLDAQDLPYMLSHDDGYIFPRSDAVLLGGTVERGVDDPTPVDATCLRILQRNRRFFS